VALILLTMAAGLWAWLFAPAAPASSVAAPRLHVTTTQVEAASTARAANDPAAAADPGAAVAPGTAEQATTADVPATAPLAPSATMIEAAHAPLSGVSPAAIGPRAPPVAS
jgi:hypothetical protein